MIAGRALLYHPSNMNAEFWVNLLRPIPSQTAVTPTLSVLKLVTPLSLVLCSWANPPLDRYLFGLGVLPVIVILVQIIFLTIFKLSALQSEPNHEKMRELQGLYGDSTPGRKKQGRVTSGGRSGNPQMTTAPSTTIDAVKKVEGEG